MKISRRYLNKDLENHIFDLFLKAIVNIRNKEDAENFIEDLLYPTERIMLIKRLAIAILLVKGFTYDAIDDALKVSRSTIMNVSIWLKHGKKGYRDVINKIIEGQKREEFMDKIEELLLKLSPPKRFGSAGFERKSKQGKELVRRRLKRNLI